MSKPRRPKYQRPGAKPAPTAAVQTPPATETPSTVTEPVPNEAAPVPDVAPVLSEAVTEPAGSGPATFETSLASEDVAPEPALLDPPGDILPAPVDVTATAASPAQAATLAIISPRLLGAESFGTTVMNYFIGEGEAFAAHMRSLAGARSMAEFVRLQIGEFQRAADSTLTCWGMLAMSAGRSVAPR